MGIIEDILTDIIDLMEETVDYHDRPIIYDALVDIFSQYSEDAIWATVGRSSQFDEAVYRKYPEGDLLED